MSESVVMVLLSFQDADQVLVASMLCVLTQVVPSLVLAILDSQEMDLFVKVQ